MTPAPLARRSVLAIAATVVLLRLLTSGGYGIFRDELYYLACARHLDWGYVDHPPMVALIAWLAHTLLGDSLLALRTFPALAAGGTVVLFALTARELGGGAWAQRLAGAMGALCPTYLFLFHYLSMNSFDVLLCTAAIWLVARILRGGDARLWLAFGAVGGLALETKLSFAFLVAALAVGFVLQRDLRPLATRWFWLGAALALALFAPNVIWQARHGFPTLEFMENARRYKNAEMPPLDFLKSHALELMPLLVPLWLAGLAHYFTAHGRRFRVLGWAYLALLALMLVTHGKPYYLAPFYVLLVAPGAVLVERLGRGAPVVAVAAIALCLPTVPFGLPILPVESYLRYADALGIHPAPSEKNELGRLPQHFADLFGWEQLARDVARVRDALPPEDRARACVFAQNYGQAGAIDFYGPRLGLPPAISVHNSYHMWGTHGCDGQVAIVVAGSRERLLELFTTVEEAARHHCGDCMPYENDKPIWVVRGFRGDLGALWPKLRRYI